MHCTLSYTTQRHRKVRFRASAVVDDEKFIAMLLIHFIIPSLPFKHPVHLS